MRRYQERFGGAPNANARAPCTAHQTAGDALRRPYPPGLEFVPGSDPEPLFWSAYFLRFRQRDNRHVSPPIHQDRTPAFDHDGAHLGEARRLDLDDPHVRT